MTWQTSGSDALGILREERLARNQNGRGRAVINAIVVVAGKRPFVISQSRAAS